MSLFSRACMTAVALAVTVPLVAALPSAARDRHEGGGDRGFSRGEISGGNISRSSFWKRDHQVRNDGERHRRHPDRSAFGRDIFGGNMSRDTRRWNGWRARNDWRFGRDWQYARRGWAGQPGLWPDRVRSYYGGPYRPYYAGPYRPYYAGQYDDRERFNNNFYGGAISAYDDSGNGMYFYVDGYGDGAGDGQGGYPFSGRPANNAKVIVVSPETGAASCSFEAGVCVIRP